MIVGNYEWAYTHAHCAMILERNNVATILFCLHKLGVPSGYASSHFASHFSHFASHFSHFAHASSHWVRILLMRLRTFRILLRIFRILLRIFRILLRIFRILLRILRIKARLGPIELNRLKSDYLPIHPVNPLSDNAPGLALPCLTSGGRVLPLN
jgi:hypothetical protein